MSLLFRIVYATQARGTHHKLALDALQHMRGADSERWCRLFLAHAERYITGSKAPDDVFKDFKNHVLHPRDGYWGGAPAAAEQWYGKLVASLAAGDWSEAVWSAGVLGHYFVDPIHPFHTAQSDAENAIHRACEWSINRSYDQLRAQGLAEHPDLDVTVPDGAGWLTQMTRAGADKSNRHYEALIAHYDITRGAVVPTDGLDAVGRRMIAELLVFAATSLARVLERAIAESQATPPDVELTAATVLAALAMPRNLILKKFADAADRRQVEAMYDELVATGKVEKTLPVDDRTVKTLHAAEVLKWSAPAPAVSPAAPGSLAAALSAPNPLAETTSSPTEANKGLLRLDPTAVVPPPLELPTFVPDAVPSAIVEPVEAPRKAPVREVAERAPRRTRLTPDDPVEAAPSIGPKTAARLAAVGIHTVRELFAANPADVARGLAVRHITAADVEAWQRQAALVIALPALSGTAAQLLVGAGFPDIAAIAETSPADLCARVLEFARGTAGQRILRDGAPPDIETVKAWAEAACAAKAA